MRKLLRVSDRHQITLPPAVLKDAGVGEGSYLEIRVREGKIVLEPTELSEKPLSAQDWEKLDQLVKKQVRNRQYSEYSSPKEAKKHLK